MFTWKISLKIKSSRVFGKARPTVEIFYWNNSSIEFQGNYERAGGMRGHDNKPKPWANSPHTDLDRSTRDRMALNE
jgi:hypothetical protein